jgi:hypothetical protein
MDYDRLKERIYDILQGASWNEYHDWWRGCDIRSVRSHLAMRFSPGKPPSDYKIKKALGMLVDDGRILCRLYNGSYIYLRKDHELIDKFRELTDQRDLKRGQGALENLIERHGLPGDFSIRQNKVVFEISEEDVSSWVKFLSAYRR